MVPGAAPVEFEFEASPGGWKMGRGDRAALLELNAAKAKHDRLPDSASGSRMNAVSCIATRVFKIDQGCLHKLGIGIGGIHPGSIDVGSEDGMNGRPQRRSVGNVCPRCVVMPVRLQHVTAIGE